MWLVYWRNLNGSIEIDDNSVLFETCGKAISYAEKLNSEMGCKKDYSRYCVKLIPANTD